MCVVLVASVMGSLGAIVLGLSALSLSAEVAPPAPVRARGGGSNPRDASSGSAARAPTTKI